jgi:hypothetical protein
MDEGIKKQEQGLMQARLEKVGVRREVEVRDTVEEILSGRRESGAAYLCVATGKPVTRRPLPFTGAR